MKTFTELSKINSFEDRFEYCNLHGIVAERTFGSHRWYNQKFYASKEWAEIRNAVIVRDLGNDLSHPAYPIGGKIYVHHLNPITLEDLIELNEIAIDPEYMVCVSKLTHDAIHYGSFDTLPKLIQSRFKDDTKLW